LRAFAQAYLASVLANHGSPCRPRRTVLIDPVCFMEGVEVCSRFPFRTPEECREFAERTVLFPGFLPRPARRVLGRIFRQWVCKDPGRDLTRRECLITCSGETKTETPADTHLCVSDDRSASLCRKDIFTQYSVLRWNGTDATGVMWRNEAAEAHEAISGVKLHSSTTMLTAVGQSDDTGRNESDKETNTTQDSGHLLLP
jgi:hypothetical protein